MDHNWDWKDLEPLLGGPFINNLRVLERCFSEE